MLYTTMKLVPGAGAALGLDERGAVAHGVCDGLERVGVLLVEDAVEEIAVRHGKCCAAADSDLLCAAGQRSTFAAQVSIRRRRVR